MKSSSVCLAFLLHASLACADPGPVIHQGPAELRRGTLGDAGANTYVSIQGGFQTIHRWDLNRDGEIDLVFSQDHDADYAPDAMIYWSDADGPHSLQPELPELRSPYTLLKYTQEALKHVTWLPSFGGGRCVIADLNNDGYPDIISGNMMHNFRQDMPAYIYWGSATGFHESERTILPAFIASGIAVGDFNEDGLPDIVLANQGFERGFDARFGEMENYRASFIYWGDATGFDVAHRLSIPTISAADVAAGDFNGDGHLDLAFVNDFHDEQSVYIYWGDGTGKFSDGARQVLKPAGGPGLELHTATAADVDHDGITDLVIGSSTRVFIYRGTKGGLLSSVAVAELPADNCNAVEVADLNGDGRPDLVVANAGTEPAQPKSYIYWGGPDGFKADRATALTTHGAMAVKAGDLNHDGFPDILFGNVSNRRGDPAQIFWGSAHGYSDLRRRDLQAFSANGVGIADLNHDGNPDVLLLNHISSQGETAMPTSIYWGNSEHLYSVNDATHLFPGGYMMHSVADLDDDGWPDLIVVSAGHPWIWWGGPDGYSVDRRTELPITKLPGSDGIFGVNVADLDGDGWLDVVCSGRAPKGPGPQVFIAYGGPGRFQAARTEAFRVTGGVDTAGSSEVTIADLNQDGKLDLIIPLLDIGKLEIRWGGSGSYANARMTTLDTNGASQAVVADLDGDGHLDLVATSGLVGRRQPGQTVVGGSGLKGGTRNSRAIIFWGNAAWDGSERTELECYQCLDVTIADLNRDGHLDLAFSSYLSDTTRELPAMIYWGDGTRHYTERRRTFLDAASSASMDAIDLNHDGWLDLVVTNHQKNFSHSIGTYIYWGGPEGYSNARRTEVPSIGSHLDTMVDAGNIRDRKYEWDMVSIPVEAPSGARFDRLRWQAETLCGTGVKFQVRTASSAAGLAQAKWSGPKGAGSFYTVSDTALAGVPAGDSWLQYRAVLTSPDGANSTRLTGVDLVCARP
ncbi:MAG: VCBS repeat-containing protein [Verrucomicrobia bacterium]|nr:VCBS repeat-containing protein [Verrucomicrobiota bacterium]